MRRFLYFFPGVGGMNAKMLGNFGALDRFTASGGTLIAHGVTQVNDGPDGSGCVVAAGTEPPQLLDQGDPSRWHQGEKFWVCVEDLPPGPADLERDVGISGYAATLGDGAQWRVPMIHRWDGAAMQHALNVPSSLQLSAGKITRRIRPEFAAIDEIAHRTFAGFYCGHSFPAESLFVDAASLLAVNYRVGVEEVSLLGLLEDGAALAHLLGLAIDQPGIERAANDASTQGIYYAENELAVAEGAD